MTDNNLYVKPLTETPEEKSKNAKEIIRESFKERFLEEVEDCHDYMDLLKTSEEIQNGKSHKLSDGLYYVAWDEYTHAKFIHECLIEWGCVIPDKELVRWYELKDRVDMTFHRN